MVIENQIFSRCVTIEHETIHFDVGLFFRNLLLFDDFILDSTRLKEFPHLVNLIGFDQTEELLKYKHFKIRCMALTIGSVGQSAFLGRTKKTLLPFGSYEFAFFTIANRRQYISDCLKCIDDIPGISFKQKKKLRKLIASKIIDEPPHMIEPALVQLQNDIGANTPAIKTALFFHLQKEHCTQNLPENLKVTINQISEKEFSAEHNLSETLRLNEFEAHKAIEQALLAVGRLNQRISEMRAFQALSGFKTQELPILDNKLSFILDRISPDKKIEQFDRVIEIANMPSFDSVGTEYELNIEEFLKIRESEECIEFRNWLSSISITEDAEIEERIKSFRSKIGSALGGKVGRCIRFLVSTVSGVFFDGGAITGPALGAVNTFVLDKMFPAKGPITFINRMYPSVFEPTSIEKSNMVLSGGRG